MHDPMLLTQPSLDTARFASEVSESRATLGDGRIIACARGLDAYARRRGQRRFIMSYCGPNDVSFQEGEARGERENALE